MEFTEMEKRMLYQTEGCERYAVINELSMASQYAGDPARRKAAKDLMEKLRPLSDAQGHRSTIFPVQQGNRSAYLILNSFHRMLLVIFTHQLSIHV